MDVQFKLGILAGSVLVMQLELLLVMIIIVLGNFFPNISILFEILAMITALILILGHIKTTVGVFGEVTDPSFNCEPSPPPKTVKEAFDITRSSAYKGVKWRFQNEIKYIKEVANFNFKYSDK